MNISSIIVLVKPEDLESVSAAIDAINGAERHFTDPSGKIIATIEAPEISEEVRILGEIEQLDRVISAQMHYSYAEEELEAGREKIGVDRGAERILSDETDISQITYGGDVNKLLEKARKGK
ncbi:MAG: chaperone NapD [Helicobacteraceae bacterium]|jgi:nitrate reductase NapD|nr:chaperone NapD [Helicobacteraceae bacterium]